MNLLRQKKQEYILRLTPDGTVTSLKSEGGSPVVESGSKVVSPAGIEYEPGEMVRGLQGKDWQKAVEYMKSPQGQEKGWKLIEAAKDKKIPSSSQKERGEMVPPNIQESQDPEVYMETVNSAIQSGIRDSLGGIKKRYTLPKLARYYHQLYEQVSFAGVNQETKNFVVDSLTKIFTDILTEKIQGELADEVHSGTITGVHTPAKDSLAPLAASTSRTDAVRDSKKPKFIYQNGRLYRLIRFGTHYQEVTDFEQLGTEEVEVLKQTLRSEYEFPKERANEIIESMESGYSRDPRFYLEALAEYITSENDSVSQQDVNRVLLSLKHKDKHLFTLGEDGVVSVNQGLKSNIGTASLKIVDALTSLVLGEDFYQNYRLSESEGGIFLIDDFKKDYFSADALKTYGAEGTRHRVSLRQKIEDIVQDEDNRYKANGTSYTIREALTLEDDNERNSAVSSILEKMQKNVEDVPSPGFERLKFAVYKRLENHFEEGNQKIPPDAFTDVDVIRRVRRVESDISGIVEAVSLCNDALNIEHATFDQRVHTLSLMKNLGGLVSTVEAASLALATSYSLGFDEGSNSYDLEMLEVLRSDMSQEERREYDSITSQDERNLYIARFFKNNMGKLRFDSAELAASKIRSIDSEFRENIEIRKSTNQHDFVHGCLAYLNGTVDVGNAVYSFGDRLLKDISEENRQRTIHDFIGKITGHLEMSEEDKALLYGYIDSSTSRPDKSPKKDSEKAKVGYYTEAVANVAMVVSLMGGSPEKIDLYAEGSVTTLSTTTREGKVVRLRTSAKNFGYADATLEFLNSEGNLEAVMPVEHKVHRHTHSDIAGVNDVKPFYEVLIAVSRENKDQIIPLTDALQLTVSESGERMYTSPLLNLQVQTDGQKASTPRGEHKQNAVG